MTDRHQRTVLTTGANAGLGLATVVHLAKLGFRSVGSVRTGDKATEVAQAATSAGVSVETRLLDVTDAERCAAVIAELTPWAVVNNAGYSGVGAIEDVTDEEARATSSRRWWSLLCGWPAWRSPTCAWRVGGES